MDFVLLEGHFMLYVHVLGLMARNISSQQKTTSPLWCGSWDYRSVLATCHVCTFFAENIDQCLAGEGSYSLFLRLEILNTMDQG